MAYTIIGMLIATAAIVAWDVYLLVDPGKPTISQVMASLPDRRPRLFALICSAWVGLAIHWWWGVCPP